MRQGQALAESAIAVPGRVATKSSAISAVTVTVQIVKGWPDGHTPTAPCMNKFFCPLLEKFCPLFKKIAQLGSSLPRR